MLRDMQFEVKSYAVRGNDVKNIVMDDVDVDG